MRLVRMASVLHIRPHISSIEAASALWYGGIRNSSSVDMAVPITRSLRVNLCVFHMVGLALDGVGFAT